MKLTGVKCTNSGCAWHNTRTGQKCDSGCHKHTVEEMVDWIGRPAMQTCTNFTWDYCQPIVKNAVSCGVCGAAADRYCNRFQCQDNYNHVGDLNVGIFADLTAPGDLVAM